jgi:DNA replication protein DnaC
MLRPVPDPSGRDDERSDCPLGVCEGNGWVLDDAGEAVPCECRERRIGKAISRGMGTGIPKRFRGVSFDRKPVVDLDPFVLRPVRAFVEDVEANLDAGRGMWFMGDVGTGKTSLAMLVSQAVEKAGRSVAVYPVTRLLAEIKDTYDSDSTGSYMGLFRRLCSVDLLHLDDLGAEKRTDWVLEQLYAIVNERWQDERSIVVTTNIVDLDELREQIGARTVSRLLEICGDPLPIMGPDLRVSSAG